MKSTKYILTSLVSTASLLPALAFAQGNLSASGGLAQFISWLRGLMNVAVPILIGLAVIAFLWGVLKFVLNAGNEEKRAEGRSLMIWGIIGIVVMVSVWGLVIFVQSSFGLGGAQHPVYPTIQ